MPTGYTYALENVGFDTKRWLKEGLVRGIGVCIMLRDDGDKTQSEIRAALVRNVENAKRYADHAGQPRELTWTDEQWREDYLAAQARARSDDYFERRSAEVLRYQKVLEELHSLQRQAAPESVSYGLLDFAIQQVSLDAVMPEEPERRPVLVQSFEDYKIGSMADAQRYAAQREADALRALDREESRLREYDKLVAFIDGAEI